MAGERQEEALQHLRQQGAELEAALSAERLRTGDALGKVEVAEAKLRGKDEALDRAHARVGCRSYSSSVGQRGPSFAGQRPFNKCDLLLCSVIPGPIGFSSAHLVHSVTSAETEVDGCIAVHDALFKQM